MNKTGIEWCNYSWNPITGCTKISEGCQNCYAHGWAKRFSGGKFPVTFHPERLEEPMTSKPGIVFVCSMSDMYHNEVKQEWRDMIFNTIKSCPQHIFVILTKRPENIKLDASFPDNVWLGVSAENQERYDERWETLLCRTTDIDIVRIVSVEPMLSPVSIEKKWTEDAYPDWVIAGPETGINKRPCDNAWIDALAIESKCFFDKRKIWTRREFPRKVRCK